MTLEMYLVMGVLVLAILMFIFEWVRVDVVGIIMMVILPLLGLVTPKQAISGLSSNAVVSIIAVIIIGAALDKTGVMNTLARVILRFSGKSESRITALIAGTVAFISGFMQNIGAAALFMPAAKRIGRQTGVPVSRILMPMGFCAIIGGCITLVGSSPLILLNDLMKVVNEDVEPWGLFSVTPVGVALVVAGIAYFIIFGRYILPAAKGEEATGLMTPGLANTYGNVGELYELHVPETAQAKSLQELDIRPMFFTTVVALINHGHDETVFTPDGENVVRPGADIAVVGPLAMVTQLAETYGWELKSELEAFAEDLSPNNAGIMEGIITPRSEFSRRTPHEVHLRRNYRVNPLALYRGDKIFVSGIRDIRLEPGDALLLQGRWESFHMLKDKPHLTFTEEVQGEILRTDKAKFAVGWLLVALSMILIFKVQLSIALLTGALGMILSRVLTIDEAYNSVDWMTVFLLGGLIPLGMAFENTGTAKFIADTIVSALGNVQPIVLLTVIGILSSFFTLVISNVGCAVLLIPLSMNMAAQAGADPRIAAMVVAVAASNTFVLPTHQVNALIMRPGGYRTVDYVRAGAGMTILYLVVMIAALMMFY
ncbi:SLC13 family permease [Desulfovibrio inopinatus]|uniref:SLC13 family permease n=1 Tax=Desulfovibrio inopinatus TaxID=102109 RepID=UPI000402F719|nr:SLC13 family permease [Desulfovibrio inopinatus]